MGEGANVPMERHSSTYFRGREAKERELANRASAPDIKEIYLSLAERYRYLAENAEATEREGIRRRAVSRDGTSPWD
jgi:hypothetical protein